MDQYTKKYIDETIMSEIDLLADIEEDLAKESDKRERFLHLLAGKPVCVRCKTIHNVSIGPKRIR